jgi:sugar phosphate permease
MNVSKSVRVRRMQWVAVTLLMLMGIVNYLDRSTISIANHLISKDLLLSATQMGMIFSVFSWAYAFGQLPLGAILDRCGARWSLGIALSIWSTAQALCGVTSSMGQLLSVRAVLGVGEAPQYIGGVKAISDWFNICERGAPIGIFLASTTMGSMIGPPLLTALMVKFGWRGMFVIMGVAGLVLAIMWFSMYRDRDNARLTSDDARYFMDGEVAARAEMKPTGAEWKALLTQRTTWGIALGFVGVMYMVLLTLAWLPGYFERERHLSIVGTGWVLTIPYLFATVGMFSSGYVADRLVARGWAPITSRKLPLCIGLAGGAIFAIPTVFTSSLWLAVGYLSFAMFFINFAGGAAWGLVSVAAPRHLVASLGSVQNFVGFLGGSFAPVITGWILDRTQSIANAFLLASVIAFLSMLAYLMLVSKPIRSARDAVDDDVQQRQSNLTA